MSEYTRATRPLVRWADVSGVLNLLGVPEPDHDPANDFARALEALPDRVAEVLDSSARRIANMLAAFDTVPLSLGDQTVASSGTQVNVVEGGEQHYVGTPYLTDNAAGPVVPFDGPPVPLTNNGVPGGA